MNATLAYTKLEHGYRISKFCWPPVEGLKSAIAATGSNFYFVFLTCDLVTITVPLGNFTLIQRSSSLVYKKKTDAESCINTLAYHAKTANDICCPKFRAKHLSLCEKKF